MAQFGGDKKDHIGRRKPASMGKFVLKGGDEFRFTLLDRLETFRIPTSLSEIVFNYRLTPGGSEPAYIRHLKKAYYLTKSVAGGAHANEVYESLMQFITLGTDELFKKRNEVMQNVGLMDIMVPTLTTVQKDLAKKNNKAAKYLLKVLEEYTIDALDAKILTVDDPRFIHDSMVGKSFDKLPDNIRQRGGLLKTPDGKFIYVTHGALSQQFPEDADGDVKSLIRFTSKDGSGKDYAIGIKSPGYRRLGIIELQDMTDFRVSDAWEETRELFKFVNKKMSPNDSLNISMSDIMAMGTIDEDGNKKRRMGPYKQRQEVIDVHNVARLGLRTVSQIEGSIGADRTSAVVDLIADEIVAQTTKSSGAGLLNNAVKTGDLYKAFTSIIAGYRLTEKEVEELVPIMMAQYVNRGDNWFVTQELKGLKKTGAGGVDLIKLSPYKLVGVAKEVILNYKDFGGKSLNEKLGFLNQLAAREGLDFEHDPTIFPKVMERFNYYLSNPLAILDHDSFDERRILSEAVEKQIAAKNKAEKILRSKGKGYYRRKQYGGGVVASLESAGLIELRAMDTSSVSLGLTPDQLKTRGTLKALLTSDMNGNMSGTMQGVSPDGATKGNVIGNIIFVDANREAKLISGSEAMLAYADQKAGDLLMTSKHKIGDKSESLVHSFGKLDSIEQENALSIKHFQGPEGENFRKRVASDLVKNDADLFLAGYMAPPRGASKDLRIQKLANHIAVLANSNNSGEMNKLIVRWDLTSSEGRGQYTKVLDAMSEFMSMYGHSTDILLDSTGTARFRDATSASQTAGYIPVSSEIQSVTNNDYAEVHISANTITPLTLTVKESKANHVYHAALADPFGGAAIGSGHGTKHSRMSKSRSQLTGVTLRARTGIIAPDWDKAHLKDPRYAGQGVADIWKAMTAYQINAVGDLVEKEDLGVLTNLPNMTGAGQGYATNSFYRKLEVARRLISDHSKTFDESISDQDLIELGFNPDNVTYQERMTVTSSLKKMRSMPTNEQEIFFTKVLDRTGTVKQMPWINMDITATLPNGRRVEMDYILEAAEINQKYKNIIGFIIDSAIEAHPNMDRGLLYQRINQVFDEIKVIAESGGSDADIKMAIDDKMKHLTTWAGLVEAEFDVKEKNVRKVVKGYIKTHASELLASINVSETNYGMDDPKLKIKAGWQSQEMMEKYFASGITDLVASMAESESDHVSNVELNDLHDQLFLVGTRVKEEIAREDLTAIEAQERLIYEIRSLMYGGGTTGNPGDKKTQGSLLGNALAQANKLKDNPIMKAMPAAAGKIAGVAAVSVAALAMAQVLKNRKDNERRKYESIR